MTLVAEHLSKSFGPIRAVSDVSLTLRKGAVHAIVGENGAGKSTTLRMLSGAWQPSAGHMMFNSKPYAPYSHVHAAQFGVELVHQEITINRSLSIAENVYIRKLRNFSRRFGGIQRKKMADAAQEVLDSIGVNISVSTNIDRLNLGEMKCVEIARAISSSPQVLLLDESTAYLDHREVDAVLRVMTRLKSQGITIGFVSHHLHEVQAVADDLTILKDGQLVGSFHASEIELVEIQRLMVGRDISQNFYPPRPTREETERAPIVFRADNIAVGLELKEASLEVRAGEVLGIAGLKGAGAEALFMGIVGDERLDHGDMKLEGSPYHPKNPRHAWQQGIAHLPGDRGNEGLIPDFSVMENLVMARPLAHGPVFDNARARSLSSELIKEIGIKTASMDATCRSLSGGNMQKVMIGKCLATEPHVILLNNPTRGVDVGARMEIYRLIRKRAKEGLAIILSSEDMPELLGMSDRLIVLRQGRVANEFSSTEGLKEHDVVGYMT